MSCGTFLKVMCGNGYTLLTLGCTLKGYTSMGWAVGIFTKKMAIFKKAFIHIIYYFLW